MTTIILKIVFWFVVFLFTLDATKYILRLSIEFFQFIISLFSMLRKTEKFDYLNNSMESKLRKVLSIQYVRILKYERSKFSQAHEQIIETNIYIDTLKRQLKSVLFHPTISSVKITASETNFRGVLIIFFYNRLLSIAVRKYGSGYKLESIIKDLTSECIKNVKMVNYKIYK